MIEQVDILPGFSVENDTERGTSVFHFDGEEYLTSRGIPVTEKFLDIAEQAIVYALALKFGSKFKGGITVPPGVQPSAQEIEEILEEAKRGDAAEADHQDQFGAPDEPEF